LESDLDGTAVGVPNQIIPVRFAHPWMIARLKFDLSTFDQASPTWRELEAANRHGTYAAKVIGPWINDRAGVVWDQQ
jgi:hypothetical protein